jgi:hypothetical protein
MTAENAWCDVLDNLERYRKPLIRKLTVIVTKADIFSPRLLDAEIPRVRYPLSRLEAVMHVWIPPREFLGYCARTIGRVIIHDDNLVTACIQGLATQRL